MNRQKVRIPIMLTPIPGAHRVCPKVATMMSMSSMPSRNLVRVTYHSYEDALTYALTAEHVSEPSKQELSK